MSCEINKIIKSPKEKYTLKISSIETKPGCWNYTIGEVSNSLVEVITSIKRNYSSFPYLFVEDHPNGHDYFIGGKDYQGQTVVELDTGKIKDFLPEEAKQGHGFCWGSYTWSPEQQLLIVSGCHWACPYEWRFYDFSNPMNGWTELKTDNDDYFDDSGKEPTVSGDEITAYDARDLAGDDSDEENIQAVAWKKYKRNGLILNFVEQWIEPTEEKRRKENKERQEKWNKEWKIYQTTDPLYLMVKEAIDGSSDFTSADKHVGIGQVYDSWCPHFKDKDGRICKRIANKQEFKNHKWTIDLEWGRNIAPIKLEIYRDGKTFKTKWFLRSIEGMNQSISYAKKLIGIKDK